jgi:hypothetical protein
MKALIPAELVQTRNGDAKVSPQSGAQLLFLSVGRE